MKKDFWVSIAICLMVYGVAVLGQQVSNSLPEWVERVDRIATPGQTAFSTQALPRSNFVLVWKNGQLETQEMNPLTCAPTCADYTAANVSGKRIITFLLPLSPGIPLDRVSLIYWR